LTDFGAFARIENTDLEGLIHISELSMDRVGHPSEVVSVGETLALRVISLDMERHRIGLSLEKVDSDEFAAIDFEQIQEELGEEGSLDDILSGADEEGAESVEEAASEEDVEEVAEEEEEESAPEDDTEEVAEEEEEESAPEDDAEEVAEEEEEDTEVDPENEEPEEESPPDEEK
jgi:transcriptional accessory protein Tex/SPT6